MVTLDSVINFAVVAIIIVVGLGIFYRALQEPIDFILGKIREWFLGASSHEPQKYKEITYT